MLWYYNTRSSWYYNHDRFKTWCLFYKALGDQNNWQPNGFKQKFFSSMDNQVVKIIVIQANACIARWVKQTVLETTGHDDQANTHWIFKSMLMILKWLKPTVVQTQGPMDMITKWLKPMAFKTNGYGSGNNQWLFAPIVMVHGEANGSSDPWLLQPKDYNQCVFFSNQLIWIWSPSGEKQWLFKPGLQ